jgi:NAD(P)-dependent dehydrogenase (short-subunit alcohol dehydrogenase family)
VGRLDGKVAIVTGAGGGIGRATAVRLAEEGAALGLTDLTADPLEEAAAAAREAGAEVESVAGDIVDPATIDALATALVERFGRIDALVNNAGIVIAKPLVEHTVEDFERLMQINVLSYLLTTQRVVGEMQRGGGSGSIVNISSIGGLVGLAGVGVYCASKAAVLGLTRSTAFEFAPDIRCNAICPGGVDTPMSWEHLSTFEDQEEALRITVGRQMIKRHAQPREIAEAILFLSSDESSFMTGAAVPVEAGHSAC